MSCRWVSSHIDEKSKSHANLSGSLWPPFFFCCFYSFWVNKRSFYHKSWKINGSIFKLLKFRFCWIQSHCVGIKYSHAFAALLYCHTTTTLLYCRTTTALLYCHACTALLYCHANTALLYCHKITALLYCHTTMSLLKCHANTALLYCHTNTALVYRHITAVLFFLTRQQQGSILTQH